MWLVYGLFILLSSRFYHIFSLDINGYPARAPGAGFAAAKAPPAATRKALVYSWIVVVNASVSHWPGCNTRTPCLCSIA